MARRPSLLPSPILVAAVALAAGCAGPPIPAPIEGLPVCPDFTSGNAKMEGSLKYPVRLRVLEGKNLLFKSVLVGLRSPTAQKPRSYIADDNAKLTVEWAQCENPHAPRTVGESPKSREKAREDEGTGYECGEATVYKTVTVETKKGDRASHVIHFEPPPNPECWTGDVPAHAPVADAGAPPAANDAGAAADAGTVTDAGAASPSTDAGATDAGSAKKTGAK